MCCIVNVVVFFSSEDELVVPSSRQLCVTPSSVVSSPGLEILT